MYLVMTFIDFFPVELSSCRICRADFSRSHSSSDSPCNSEMSSSDMSDADSSDFEVNGRGIGVDDDATGRSVP